MDWEAAQIRADACTKETLEIWKKDVAGRPKSVKRPICEESVALVEREFAQSVESPRRAAALEHAAALTLQEAEETIKEAYRIWALYERNVIPPSGITLGHSVTTEKAFAIFVRHAETPLTPHNIQTLVAERLKDLDDLLFHGDLDNKIPVLWKALGPDLMGQTLGGRGGGPGDKSNIRIEMTESLIPWAVSRPDLIWGTLIHELLHAYALVMAPEHEMCLCGHRVAHGPGFAAAAAAAVKMLEIKSMTFESIATYERGLCHSDCDDVVLARIERKGREKRDSE